MVFVLLFGLILMVAGFVLVVYSIFPWLIGHQPFSEKSRKVCIVGAAFIIPGITMAVGIPLQARDQIMHDIQPGTVLVVDAVPDTVFKDMHDGGKPGLDPLFYLANKVVDSSLLLTINGEKTHARVVFTPLDKFAECGLFANNGHSSQAVSLPSLLQWGYSLLVVSAPTAMEHRWLLSGEPVKSLQGCKDVKVLVTSKDLMTLVILAKNLPEVIQKIQVSK